MANVDIEKVVSPTFSSKYRVRVGDEVPFGDSDVLYKCAWRYTHPEVKDEKMVHWVAIFSFISKDGKAITGICKVVTKEDEDGMHIPDGGYYSDISLNERWEKMFVCKVELEPHGDTTLEERVEDIYIRIKKHIRYKTISVSDLISALTVEFRHEDDSGWIFPSAVEDDLVKWKEGLPTPHLLEAFNSNLGSNYTRLLEYREPKNLKVWWKTFEVPLTNLLPKHLRSRFKNEKAMFSKDSMELHYNMLSNYTSKSDRILNQIVDLEDEDFGVYISKDYGWDRYIYLMVRTRYSTLTHFHVFTHLWKFEIYAFPITNGVKIKNGKDLRLKDEKDIGFIAVEEAILAYHKDKYLPNDIKFVLEYECEFKLTNYDGNHSWNNGPIKHNWTLDFKPKYEEMIADGLLINRKRNEADDKLSDINKQTNKAYETLLKLDEKTRMINNCKTGFEDYDMIAQGEDIKICREYVNERIVPCAFVDDDFETTHVSKPKKNAMELYLKFKLTNHVFCLKKSDIVEFSIVRYGGLNDREDGIRRKIYEPNRVTCDAIVRIVFKYADEIYHIHRYMAWHSDYEKPDLSDYDRVLNGWGWEIERKERIKNYRAGKDFVESLRDKWITNSIYVEDGSLKIDVEKDISGGGTPFKTTLDRDSILGFRFLKGREGIGTPTGVNIWKNKWNTKSAMRSEAIVEIKFLYEKEIKTIKRYVTWIDGKDNQ